MVTHDRINCNALQRMVAEFRREAESVFPTPSPRDSMAFVLEEATEVQRALMKSGYADGQYLRGNTEPPDLEGEIGDLVFMVATLATQLEVDLTLALQKTLSKLYNRVEVERVRRQEVKHADAE